MFPSFLSGTHILICLIIDDVRFDYFLKKVSASPHLSRFLRVKLFILELLLEVPGDLYGEDLGTSAGGPFVLLSEGGVRGGLM